MENTDALSQLYMDRNSARPCMGLPGCIEVYHLTSVQPACRVFPDGSMLPAIAGSSDNCILTIEKSPGHQNTIAKPEDSPISIKCINGGFG